MVYRTQDSTGQDPAQHQSGRAQDPPTKPATPVNNVKFASPKQPHKPLTVLQGGNIPRTLSLRNIRNTRKGSTFFWEVANVQEGNGNLEGETRNQLEPEFSRKIHIF